MRTTPTWRQAVRTSRAPRSPDRPRGTVAGADTTDWRTSSRVSCADIAHSGASKSTRPQSAMVMTSGAAAISPAKPRAASPTAVCAWRPVPGRPSHGARRATPGRGRRSPPMTVCARHCGRPTRRRRQLGPGGDVSARRVALGEKRRVAGRQHRREHDCGRRGRRRSCGRTHGDERHPWGPVVVGSIEGIVVGPSRFAGCSTVVVGGRRRCARFAAPGGRRRDGSI